MPAVLEQDEVEIDFERRRLISWGAVFAGLVTVVAVSWLMYLLGVSIGVSVADATDWRAMGNGLGIGALVWLILTPVIAYFLGAMVASRLCGKTSDLVGMLHGIVLWGAGATLMLVLGYAGLKGLIQTGQGFVTGAAQVTKTVAGGASGAVGAIEGEDLDWAVDTAVAREAQARLKRWAADSAAEVAADSEASVRQDEVRRAINDLDADALARAGRALVMGDPEQAKHVLAINTTLSDEQIDAVVAGVQTEMQETLEEYRREFERTMETASDYAQGVVWTAFGTTALALVASVLGGWLGSEAGRRVTVLRVREERGRETTETYGRTSAGTHHGRATAETRGRASADAEH